MLRLSPLPNYQLIISQRSDGSVESATQTKLLLQQTLTAGSESTPSPSICYFHHHHQAERFILTKQPRTDLLEVWADAVISHQPVFLAMRVADCFPIAITVKNSPVFALIHAGWKPLLQSIIQLTLIDLQLHFQIKLRDILVWIGPGIGPCCYKFAHEPVQAQLHSWQDHVQKISSQDSSNKWSIDLAGFATDELIRLGVGQNSIINYQTCTACLSDSLFSHYQAQARLQKPGRMMIALGPKT